MREVVQKLVAFLPSLLTGIVVFLIGLGLAWLIKLLVIRIARLFKVDAAFARSGVTDALQKMAVKDTPSKLIGRTFFWLVTFIFFILALKVMKVPVIDQLLEKLLLYLPNIFVALIIVTIGWLLGNFLGRAALIASVNSGVKTLEPAQPGGQGGHPASSPSSWPSSSSASDGTRWSPRSRSRSAGLSWPWPWLSVSGGKDLARTYLEKRFKKPTDGGGDDLKHL